MDHLRIAISGAASTGKTTVCQSLIEIMKSEFGIVLNFVTSPIKRLQKELGFDINTGSPDDRLKFQYDILFAQIENEKQNPFAVFDRAWTDYVSYFKIFFPSEFEAYRDVAKESSPGYDLHFFLRYGSIPRVYIEGRFKDESIDKSFDMNLIQLGAPMIEIKVADHEERIATIINHVKKIVDSNKASDLNV